MKRVLMAAIAVIALASTVACAGYNKIGCQQAVMDHFQTTDARPLPHSDYCFIARDQEGNVWYVECMSVKSTKITKKIILIPKK